jgi:hypothetical protein
MDYVNLTINLKLEEVISQLYVIKEAEYVGYGLYLYFLEFSTRKVAKALSFLHIVKRSHVSSGSGSRHIDQQNYHLKEERYLNL